MTVTGPYAFRMYSQEGDDIETIRRAGLEPTRVIMNDGSVPVSGFVNGERTTILFVRPIAPRKRNTPYDAPDPERDELAQRIADALNTHAATPEPENKS